jgi:hypothetical protein
VARFTALTVPAAGPGRGYSPPGQIVNRPRPSLLPAPPSLPQLQHDGALTASLERARPAGGHRHRRSARGRAYSARHGARGRWRGPGGSPRAQRGQAAPETGGAAAARKRMARLPYETARRDGGQWAGGGVTAVAKRGDGQVAPITAFISPPGMPSLCPARVR